MRIWIAAVVVAVFLAGLTVGVYARTKSTELKVIDIGLNEWSVTPSEAKVDYGSYRFVVQNQGQQAHQLTVLALAPDGKKLYVQEVLAMPPGGHAEFITTLPPGHYELACVIKPGQVGSTVDHYLQGMHATFDVQ